MKRLVCVSLLLAALASGILPGNAHSQFPINEFFDTAVNRDLIYMYFRDGNIYFRGISYHNYSEHYQYPAGSNPQSLGNFWGSLTPRTDLLRYIVESGGSGNMHYILLSNGDMYANYSEGGANPFSGDPFYMGNFWGGTVSTDESAWGGIKELFKK
jgi:hypothetical protein